jgi:hypothetical protein
MEKRAPTERKANVAVSSPHGKRRVQLSTTAYPAAKARDKRERFAAFRVSVR